MLAARIIVALVAAYLIGGIPWALIIGKAFYGVDVRKEGSGNLGATNVYRVLGTRAGVLTAVLDIGKGALAVLVAWALVPPSLSAVAHDWTLVGATLAAILGHSYSPYIRFAGGKGVAVAAGALLVLTPKVWPILLVVWVTCVALTRIVSVGSIAVAALYPVLTVWFYGSHVAFVIFSVVGAALVIWRHRSNIARLMRGEESKMSWKPGGMRGRGSRGGDSAPPGGERGGDA